MFSWVAFQTLDRKSFGVRLIDNYMSSMQSELLNINATAGIASDMSETLEIVFQQLGRATITAIVASHPFHNVDARNGKLRVIAHGKLFQKLFR